MSNSNTNANSNGSANVPGSNARTQQQMRPRLRLPFDNRPTDAGLWAYEHRRGLAVTLIVYLLAAIAFVAGKITVGNGSHANTIVIDLDNLETLQAERDRLLQENRRLQYEERQWQKVRNLSSNEALNENLKDDRGTKTAQLNQTADEVERTMRANREAYEQGLSEISDITRRRDDPRDDKQENAQSSKVAGRVTVSYLLTDPVRHHRYLDKPAYKCEGGGEVVVGIAVDRSGKVTDASVLSGGDLCMRETALRSAKASVFDINDRAPAKQTGTITYIFIPQ